MGCKHLIGTTLSAAQILIFHAIKNTNGEATLLALYSRKWNRSPISNFRVRSLTFNCAQIKLECVASRDFLSPHPRFQPPHSEDLRINAARLQKETERKHAHHNMYNTLLNRFSFI